MKINRPLTAPKEKHLSKFESKLTIPGYKRPVSAKTHSLKQIIQVIENTLNRGAQTILTKAKTLDKFSKFKMQMDRVKKYKDRQLHDKDFPQYKTEFIIGNSQDFQGSSISIKSTKSIKYSHQHVQFTPYDRNNSKPAEVSSAKPAEVPMQKRSFQSKYGIRNCQKQRKIVQNQKKVHIQQITDNNRESAIEGWQNQQSIMHISYLLNDLRA